MKAPNPRLAMLLSIGGVLVAGSAAALVNARVLDDQSRGAPPAATAVSTTSIPGVVQLTTTPTVATVPVTLPLTTAAPTTAVPVAVSAVVTAPPTTTTTTPSPATVAAATAPPGGTLATYRLGQAGTALLDTAGGRLTVVQVTPAAGWFVERAESDGTEVEIRLESGSGEVRFEASLVRGVVRVSLDTDDDSDGDDGGGSGSGNSGHGGDDDDDNSGPGSDD
jgi:hypothetical protein